MSDRIEIQDENMESVSGGQITYCWNGEKGSLGINGNNKYELLDKEAFLTIYNQMFGEYSDADIVRTLRENGIIRKP